MDRQKAIRSADIWRIGNRTQVAGMRLIETHDSISKAKKRTRRLKCVALRPDDLGHGEQEFGFFRA